MAIFGTKVLLYDTFEPINNNHSSNNNSGFLPQYLFFLWRNIMLFTTKCDVKILHFKLKKFLIFDKTQVLYYGKYVCGFHIVLFQRLHIGPSYEESTFHKKLFFMIMHRTRFDPDCWMQNAWFDQSHIKSMLKAMKKFVTQLLPTTESVFYFYWNSMKPILTRFLRINVPLNQFSK